MAKQLISGLILEYFPQICRLKFFVIVLPLLVVKLCSKFVPNFVPKMTKNVILEPILAHLAKNWAPILFREFYFY